LRRRKYSSLSEINVTNLVDVTLVLLIIFMITAPLLKTGILVELPKTEADRIDVRRGVVVSIDKGGIVYIDDQKVSIENFAPMLLKKYDTSGGQKVLLRGDKSVFYGKVMEIMDLIKKSGINNVGLVVEPVEKE
jgi:biopolymer transport protein TolR